ncbi:unnamed protein product [Cladocopium goreaui]|uniref:Agmatinase, putative n=1 Tax=Cladocopium goreaui TaxID=2562237 RepID=A0A9P1M233_9DINO|nr:unnamed protein product [Cladocopium goreaui]
MAVAAATVEASEQRRRGISTTSDHSGLSPQRGARPGQGATQDILEMALAEEGIKDSIQMRFAKNSRERAETHWHRLADEDEEDDFGWDTDDSVGHVQNIPEVGGDGSLAGCTMAVTSGRAKVTLVTRLSVADSAEDLLPAQFRAPWRRQTSMRPLGACATYYRRDSLASLQMWLTTTRLVELSTQAAAASLVELLSLATQSSSDWTQPAGLRFKLCSSYTFLKTEEKDVQVGTAQVQESESVLGNWRSTVRNTVKVTEHLWNHSSHWHLNDTQGTLLHGFTGELLKTLGDRSQNAQNAPTAPAPSSCETEELSMRWLRDGVHFAVNRSSPDCRTPSVNLQTQAALDFFGQLETFAGKSEETLLRHMTSGEAQVLPQLQGKVFKPVLALFAMENASKAVLTADLPMVLSFYRRSLAEKLEENDRMFGAKVETSLIRLSLLLAEMKSLARQMLSSVKALEGLLHQQLTAALGKQIRSRDFSEYMDFHGRLILGEGFAPEPFVYAVRRPDHHPEGTISIESGFVSMPSAIRTFTLHRREAPTMRVQLNSAATVTLQGEHFVHAAIFHRFAREPEQDAGWELRLVARARQLSSFVLMVGKIAAAVRTSLGTSLMIREDYYDYDGGYDHGRLNLPFVGHTTFGKYPPFTDWTQLASASADFAVLGVPNDMGTQYRSGARMGPRGIREASTLYQFGHKEVYDSDTGETYSYGSVVDVGDVDIVHTDQVLSLNRTQEAVEAILRAQLTPMILGGDHAITAPVCAALAVLQKPLVVVQIDAHLDFVDQRHGVRFGHGNSMRRCLEMPRISSMFQLGIRGVSSTAKSGFEDAKTMGSTVLSVRKVRELGVASVVERVPSGSLVYISIDIDGLDPSIAPGTGTPSHGGFLYYEVKDLLRLLISRTHLVGLDLVEVSPPYDVAGVTTTLAARLVLDRFEPSAALIIQNKDDLVIPLLLETVPTPKEFIDSIQSLSPEQQRFAQAFRKMQLSSSLFAVAVVQIKPLLATWRKGAALWLGAAFPDVGAESAGVLVDQGNTRENWEIQLTQDLIELFVRYQVPPDLMSYDEAHGSRPEKLNRVSTAEKLKQVKDHVEALWQTIAASKSKQLKETQEEAKMRNMQKCGAEECPNIVPMSRGARGAGDAEHAEMRPRKLATDLATNYQESRQKKRSNFQKRKGREKIDIVATNDLATSNEAGFKPL